MPTQLSVWPTLTWKRGSGIGMFMHTSLRKKYLTIKWCMYKGYPSIHYHKIFNNSLYRILPCRCRSNWTTPYSSNQEDNTSTSCMSSNDRLVEVESKLWGNETEAGIGEEKMTGMGARQGCKDGRDWEGESQNAFMGNAWLPYPVKSKRLRYIRHCTGWRKNYAGVSSTVPVPIWKKHSRFAGCETHSK